MTAKPTTPAELREQAARWRKLATISTSGGHRVDRLLLQMAARLEYDADQMEREGGGC